MPSIRPVHISFLLPAHWEMLSLKSQLYSAIGKNWIAPSWDSLSPPIGTRKKIQSPNTHESRGSDISSLLKAYCQTTIMKLENRLICWFFWSLHIGIYTHFLHFHIQLPEKSPVCLFNFIQEIMLLHFSKATGRGGGSIVKPRQFHSHACHHTCLLMGTTECTFQMMPGLQPRDVSRGFCHGLM